MRRLEIIDDAHFTPFTSVHTYILRVIYFLRVDVCIYYHLHLRY